MSQDIKNIDNLKNIEDCILINKSDLQYILNLVETLYLYLQHISHQ